MLEYRIPEEADNPYRLGRHVLHDPRSRNFRVPMATEIKPQNWTRQVPIFDQGSLGSCTGNAAVGSIGTNWNAGQGLVTAPDSKSLNEDYAVSVYSRATELDPFTGTYPPNDTGSNGLSVAKVLKERGIIDSYQHAFGLADLEAALQTGPAIVGTNWYSSMFQPNNMGVVSIATNAYVAGGHEYCAVGINPTTQTIKFANSWGSEWADNGFFYASYSTVDRLLSEDGDVTVFRPVIKAPTPPIPFPSSTTVQLDADVYALAQSRALRAKLSVDAYVSKRMRTILR